MTDRDLSSPLDRLSQRSAFDPTPNALAQAVARHPPRFDLTLSNPTAAGLAYPEAVILEALADRGSLRYAPHPFGLPTARQAVADLLGTSPDRVVLTASTSEAYAWLFKLLCDPGDDVLCPAPSYPLFEHLARYESVRLNPYRLAYDGAWHVDLDSLRPTPRTRAVLVVSPNNPTGQYASEEELTHLAEQGLPLVVDEVFAPYRLVPGEAPRGLDAPGRVFALGGLSKQAGLPQLKAGWIAVGGDDPEPVMERLELIADTYLSVGSPVQRALPTLLEHRIESTIRDRVRGNLQTLRTLTAGSPTSVLRVEGGWSAVLELPRVRSEEAWVLSFLEEDGVRVQPGWLYDFEREAYAVVSLLPPPESFTPGVSRLVARVRHTAG